MAVNLGRIFIVCLYLKIICIVVVDPIICFKSLEGRVGIPLTCLTVKKNYFLTSTHNITGSVFFTRTNSKPTVTTVTLLYLSQTRTWIAKAIGTELKS